MGSSSRGTEQNWVARILVVDDDASLLEVLPDTLLLHLWRVEIHTCRCPLTALARLRTEPFDVVLTDFTLPGMSGLELLTELKRTAPWVAVIVMTGHRDDALYGEARRAGAVDILCKPFGRTELIAAFKAVLKARATLL